MTEIDVWNALAEGFLWMKRRLGYQGMPPDPVLDGTRSRNHIADVRLLFVVIGSALTGVPALALDEPAAWRDPDSGCAYWLTPQGGIAPRFRRDGTPDCPESDFASRSLSPASPLVSDQAVRELGRGLDALRREVERLSDRMRR
jgi:hypothetical protein